ncbi:CFI-box-CTERM domain-containing protein [Haloplanus sp. GCM10025708]|uniref:CFI-box-CTERM domain-containing protein n=1 Tax=Haloferacaceae TaxID=1644056 RepID=UPI00360F1E4B
MSEEGSNPDGDASADSRSVDESTTEGPADAETGADTASEPPGDADAVDEDESPADAVDEDDGPVEVGDGREKHVTVVTEAGTEVTHGDVYLRHSEEGFAVSPEAEFPAAETTRYRKANLERVEVTQHHAACFITTATAGDGPTLDALRGFRDGVMTASRPGRALLWVYDAVSPPIAATLARHPDARSTRLVRWLVERCGAVARRREESGATGRTLRSLSLTALYVVGVCLAAAAHLWLSTTGGPNGRESARRD